MQPQLAESGFWSFECSLQRNRRKRTCLPENQACAASSNAINGLNFLALAKISSFSSCDLAVSNLARSFLSLARRVRRRAISRSRSTRPMCKPLRNKTVNARNWANFRINQARKANNLTQRGQPVNLQTSTSRDATVALLHPPGRRVSPHHYIGEFSSETYRPR